MRKTYWGRFLLGLTVVVAATCAWASEISPIVPQADGSYSVTVKATHKFTRNTQKLKDEALDAATKFCAKDGKQVKVVSATEDKSMYLVGAPAQTTLIFKALPPGDPELATVTEDHPRPPAPMNADTLTSELTKLDDLRKKGLLTDEEFTAAKKKLLDRM